MPSDVVILRAVLVLSGGRCTGRTTTRRDLTVVRAAYERWGA